jgi:lipopolysaccharide/colanic/teichoic acid biosynthesis glycosyltransferase
MVSGWRYRLVSAGGTGWIAAVCVVLANHPRVQTGVTAVPVLGRLPAVTLTDSDLGLAVATTLVVVLAAFVPLFKPRPRRVLDTLVTVESRVLVAVFALATVGYFDYTYRLPRATLVVAAGLLAVACPAWFLLLRGEPAVESRRAVVVGDDPEAIEDVLDATDVPVIGYVSPPFYSAAGEAVGRRPVGAPDGGRVVESSLADLECLGGLSRLGEVLVRNDVDTAVLAFAEPDRAEFFGTLDTLYDHGVTAKVHRDHADAVLTAGVGVGDLVNVEVEPWDWQDYVLKRLFDVVFAAVGLVVLAPLMAVVAVAIKLDSDGPVLYRQTRTAAFGEPLTVPKFRSMVTDAEAESGATLSDEDAGDVDPRVTRVGRVLRETHLDELPQLWLILRGDMTVVGPRPERPTLDRDMEADVGSWRRRWFVKPGLTGLAQINDATGFDPQEKLRYDVTYIRNQSLVFDCKILARQLWQVAVDVAGLLRSSLPGGRGTGTDGAEATDGSENRSDD